jgi:hypothetical protein
MKWVTIFLGALLFLAPFLSGYSGQTLPLYFSLISGLFIVILGFSRFYKKAIYVGFFIIVAPWIFGISGVAASCCYVIGFGIALLSDYGSLIFIKI